MPVSEARINANRVNSLKSTGPKTAEGKARSCQNGLKHGMTGQGVVIPPSDVAEVERRNQAIGRELAPRSAIGEILVRQLATLSVRMERGARQEFAAVASNVSHALEEFDAERIETAEYLMKSIGDDPRGRLRELRQRPEGVALMIDAWRKLRAELTRTLKPGWKPANLTIAVNLQGLTIDEAFASRIDVLSRAACGSAWGLTDHDGAGLDHDARTLWAQGQLVDVIDAEIAELTAHAKTIDIETIQQDRAQAPERALFDPSREASLARRYEAEARRGFFRALEKFHQAEAHVAALHDSTVEMLNSDEDETCDSLASSRQSEIEFVRTVRPDHCQSAEVLMKREEMLPRGPIARSMNSDRAQMSPVASFG